MTTIERSGLIPHTDMPNTLRTARVRTVLSRLFAVAAHKRPNTVIEFATSYGISIIDLAAAVADNALGRVVTTELSEAKGAGRSRKPGGRLPRGSRHDSARRCHDGYLEYARQPANGYVSVAFPVADGREITCWTADGPYDENGAV